MKEINKRVKLSEILMVFQLNSEYQYVLKI